MRRRKKPIDVPPKYILLALTILCVILMVVSLFFDGLSSSLKGITGAIITPMQKGVNSIGTYVEKKVDAFRNYEDVVAENNDLKEQLQSYQSEIKQYQQDSYELNRLKNLYELDSKYPDYKKTVARVIAKDSGNWFDVFYIDKGTDDGVVVGCNVLFGNGLCGIVTDAGTDYAQIRAIIDDTSNVNAMVLPAEAICDVSGSLTNTSARCPVPSSRPSCSLPAPNGCCASSTTRPGSAASVCRCCVPASAWWCSASSLWRWCCSSARASWATVNCSRKSPHPLQKLPKRRRVPNE